MLDEIGDLPHSLQAKLLRFLQERTVERIGGRSEIPVDVRVVCATHQNLRDQIKSQLFREDLYYRLAEIVIDIPPLRLRKGDAVLLAKVFLQRYSEEHRRGQMIFSDSAVRAIDLHQWPGNVRELQNAVKRAAIMAEDGRVDCEDIGLVGIGGGDFDDAGPSFDLRIVREAAERQTVIAVLARCDGNMANAAKMLGVSRPTLYDLMNRLAIRQHTASEKQEP
jgi:two-component system NtrC family response regulator